MELGPAGLAIAIALNDHPEGKTIKAHFIEQQPEYAWHPGMVIPGYKVCRSTPQTSMMTLQTDS